MGRSVLDSLGEEVTGIVAPVSLCMFLTVALVRLLNPEGKSDSNAVYLATSFYTEQEGDTTGQKLSGSLINALVFVGVIAVMTFVLVLLFKHGYTKLIYAYMGFAGFSIFFVLTGVILVKLLQKFNVHLDIVSFLYMLLNFAVVGALSLFFLPAPLLMKQGYLVITGVAVAYVFTWIPEWTTWILLVAMALYDIIAVLMPGGPLKMLVELAQEREEQIPALVYEARPVRRDGSVHAAERAYQQARWQQQDSPGQAAGAAAGRQEELPAAGERAPELQLERVSADSAGSSVEEEQSVPLIRPADTLSSSQGPGDGGLAQQRPQSAPIASRGLAGEEGLLAVQHSGRSAPPGAPILRVGAGTPLSREVAAELEEHPDEASAFGLPEAIKLGLGDLIFYSVLVGRAAMFDMLTVFACYLAIIAGLCCTLLLLAMAHKALPALPISITLAVAFYFIARFLLEPVVLPMTLQLVYF